MLSNSLGQFWKVLIKVEQVKSLMVVSLTPKNYGPRTFLRLFGNIITAELKIAST